MYASQNANGRILTASSRGKARVYIQFIWLGMYLFVYCFFLTFLKKAVTQIFQLSQVNFRAQRVR